MKLNDARQIVAEAGGTNLDLVRGAIENHDGFWSNYVREQGHPDGEPAFYSAAAYKKRIGKWALEVAGATGNRVLARKAKSMLRWVEAGKRAKAQDAYWALKKAWGM